MSLLTTFFNLIKPQKTDPQAIAQLNENMDVIDTEMHRPPLTVNGVEPDSTTRDLTITEVALADNLSSDIAQLNQGTFIERTSGGETSIEDGSAYLTTIKGNQIHTGYVAESLGMTVDAAERTAEEGEEPDAPITATIDRDTFVAYVAGSGTYTLIYSNAWSEDPALYGVTVTGTPIAGDKIIIVYVAEDRGLITVANPTSFNSTGWNLYNNTTGYAKVVNYSTDYGYMVGGTYTSLAFSTTVGGTQSAITVTGGLFTVPSDGYVWVTGGNDTTYILATWSDWTEGYEGNFETYSVSTIDLSSVMSLFPNGMMAIGIVRDEINLNAQTAINRIQRLAYTAENLADVIASGVDYDADTNYIYAVLETPVTTAITLDGAYTVSDHGIEYFTSTPVAVITETLYGENLKDKLRTDVLTKSQDLVNNLTTNDSTKALSAAQGYALNSNIANLETDLSSLTTYSTFTLSAGASQSITIRDTFGIMMIRATGTNIEREYIMPVYVMNAYACKFGTPIIDYSYQSSASVTISFSSNTMTITNGSSVSIDVSIRIIHN